MVDLRGAPHDEAVGDRRSADHSHRQAIEQRASRRVRHAPRGDGEGLEEMPWEESAEAGHEGAARLGGAREEVEAAAVAAGGGGGSGHGSPAPVTGKGESDQVMGEQGTSKGASKRRASARQGGEKGGYGRWAGDGQERARTGP